MHSPQTFTIGWNNVSHHSCSVLSLHPATRHHILKVSRPSKMPGEGSRWLKPETAVNRISGTPYDTGKTAGTQYDTGDTV